MASAASPHIVVVDDDPKIRTLLRRAFEPEGYRISEAGDSVGLFALMKSVSIDLITLDLTLRNEDGLEIARRIRAESRVPIIMVTGKGDMIDRIVGLELGADDYIAKPFHIREVLARVRTVLRRSAPNEPKTEISGHDHGIRRFSGWQLDLTKREVRTPEGKHCPLTAAEFDLLALFLSRANRALSREAILGELKGHNWSANDRAVDTQVARLRKKLQSYAAEP
jgi:DNA-binding response OmpR family regulator